MYLQTEPKTDACKRGEISEGAIEISHSFMSDLFTSINQLSKEVSVFTRRSSG
jgi:hypothetical protein